MCSKGSRFTLGPLHPWGSGGWGCVRSTLPNRPQPFATVRGRPCEAPYGRAYGISSAKGFAFGGCACLLLRFAWQAWHFVTFRRVLQRVESRFAWQAQYGFRQAQYGFRKMCCSFRARHSTLDVSIVMLRGRPSTSDVSCCVLFATFQRVPRNLQLVGTWRRTVMAALSGDKVQIPWHSLHFVRCDENWRKPRTKHQFWGSKFRGS